MIGFISYSRLSEMTHASRPGRCRSVHLRTLWRFISLGFCAKPSLLRDLLPQHGVDFTGVHDEAPRRRAYKMKREARYECQIATGRWFQHSNIIGCNDVNGVSAILEAMLRSVELNHVTHANIVERPEKGVPVTSQDHISQLPGQSRF